MEIFAFILLIIASILFIVAIKRTNSLVKEYEKENEELKKIRLEAVHENDVLLKRNIKLSKAMNKLKELANEQQYGSVKNIQNKIKSILNDAQKSI